MFYIIGGYMKIVRFCVLGLMAVAMMSIAMGQGSPIKMNEIQSRGVAGSLDWIELYNSSTAAFNISGYRIYDNGGQAGTKPKKPFPAGTIIPAKGFYVIITDTASFTGDLSGFGLSSGGETVWLEDTTTHTIVDTVTFGVTASAAQTYGRGPDGGAWTVLNTITRGTSNGSVVMNEIYSRGVAGSLDWIEIYNSVSASVNISGYRIYDNGGQAGTKPKKPFPVGTILPANGFYVIITDTASFTGDLSGFGLSSSGELVFLEDTTTHMIMDSVTFSATATAAQSYGRAPDGGKWQVLNTITRGTTNGTGTAVKYEHMLVSEFALNQNYPNPFNPTTMFTFEVAQSGFVSVKIYDMLGREVATLVNDVKQAGSYVVEWNAAKFNSGIYFCRMQSGSFAATKKIVFMK
jgi:hypothetical protein